MTIRLKTLSFKNFRSFAEGEVTDFPERGIYLINGINKSSGGSSNSGKSNVTNALAYLLDSCPFPGNSLQSWSTKAKMQCTATFVDGDKEIGLERGAQVAVTLGGHKTAGAKEYKPLLTKAFGLSSELMEALTYRRQGVGSLFLERSDEERKSFLNELLGLNKIEEELEAMIEEALELEHRAGALQGTSAPVWNRGVPVIPPPLDVKEWARPRDALIMAKHEMVYRKNRATENIGMQRLQHKALLDRVEKAISERSYKIKQEILANETERRNLPQTRKIGGAMGRIQFELDGLRKEAAAIEAARAREIRDIDYQIRQDQASAEMQQKNIAQQLTEVNSSLMQAQSGTCFTCKQSLPTDDAVLQSLLARKRHLQEASEAVESVRQTYGAACTKAKQDINAAYDIKKADVQARVDLWQPHLAQAVDTEQRAQREYGERVQKNRDEAAALQARLTYIREEVQKEWASEVAESLEELNGYIKKETDEQLLINDALLKIQSLESKIALAESEHRAQVEIFKRDMADYQKSVTENERINAQVGELLTEAAVLRETIALLGPQGFLGSIIEQVLADITDRTNEFLKAVPNMVGTTFALLTEKESKKGVVSKKITAQVYKSGGPGGGTEPIPLTSGLSGGMMSVVELAVDMSVQKVVEERTGVKLGWWVLDEVFDGLGPVEKEACFELLRTASHDKLVLVIEHDDKAKAFTDGQLLIEAENEQSRVVGWC
jgi:hypothetical protein